MSDIIISTEHIKVFENLNYLCSVTEKSSDFARALWDGLIINEELYEEFIFYLENRYLKDQIKIEGHSLTDIYVYTLERYNLLSDSGRNMSSCSKDALILDTFMGMLMLKKDPSAYLKMIDDEKGMDKF